MAKIKLVKKEACAKRERHSEWSDTVPVVGSFERGGTYVSFSYGDDSDEGTVYTGTDLLLKILEAPEKFKDLAGKVSHWGKGGIDRGLEDAFDQFSVFVKAWSEPPQYFEDPGISGYTATLHTDAEEETAKNVLRAFVLGILQDLGAVDYYGNYWEYGEADIPRIMKDVAEDAGIEPDLKATGCTLDDIRKVLEMSVAPNPIGVLENEYLALDGKTVEE